MTAHRVVRVESEIGSGMNGNRSKAQRLLADPNVTTVVVEHKNRLGQQTGWSGNGADHADGVVHVVRGGKHLARARHNLQAAKLTEQQRRERWEAERWFLAADGESGKRHGNETIRLTPDNAGNQRAQHRSGRAAEHG
ncbi:hypothetical protein [Streptosporangium subroseum]|uniref:hypothetical protein n=1 Tax=Streptosporangium subroseum TaxID=106412 RepID=UPI00308B3801|nr:hypothetical protein OHB15_25675 [Streptosporangium subroseum]